RFRLLRLRGRLGADGEADAEAGAATRLVQYLHGPSVTLDDVPRNREPQPRALAVGLRREERGEYMRPDVLGNTGAGVRDVELDPAVVHRPAADRDGALSADGVPRVDHEVQQHLLELVRVRPDLRELGVQGDGHVDLVAPVVVGAERQRAADDLLDLHEPPGPVRV